MALVPEKKRMLRLDVYVKKNPSLTSEEFHRHWSENHGPLLKEWLERNGVYRYTQFHTPPEMAATTLGVHDNTGWLEFDGHGECLFESPETLQKLAEDPYFKEKVEPDENRLIDKSKTMRRIGYEEIYVQDGKAL